VALWCLEAAKLAVFTAGAPAPRVYDAWDYWRLGAQVATGDVWMTHDPVAYRTPGYLWFLGALQAACGDRAWFVAVVLQYLSVWLTTVLTGWWTWRMTGRPWLAVTACLICVLSAGRASHASALLTETIFTLLLTATLYHLSTPSKVAEFGSTIVTALCWGATWLWRPVTAAVVPVWLVATWLAHRNGPRSVNWRGVLRSTAVTGVVLVAVLAPWVLRNFVLFNRPSLTVFLGRELWVTSFGPGQPAALSLPDTPESRRLQELVSPHGEFQDWDGNRIVSGMLTSRGLSDVEADELMRLVAWQAIGREPLRAIGRYLWRVIDFWRADYSRPLTFYEHVPPSDHHLNDRDLAWSSGWCTRFRNAWLDQAPEGRVLLTELASLAAVMGLGGLWLSPRTWRFGAVACACALSFTVLTAAVEYPTYRYRMVLEPLLIVSTLTGWSVLIDVLRRGARSAWQEAA
jgi:hypothetical protein